MAIVGAKVSLAQSRIGAGFQQKNRRRLTPIDSMMVPRPESQETRKASIHNGFRAFFLFGVHLRGL
jgi:hypothetical protein